MVCCVVFSLSNDPRSLQGFRPTEKVLIADDKDTKIGEEGGRGDGNFTSALHCK